MTGLVLLDERYFCLGLTAKLGTYSSVCGFRTETIDDED